MNFFELSLRLSGFRIGRAQALLSTFGDRQLERRDAIVAHHRRCNPLYRELLQGLSVKQFEDLPILTKRDLQRPLPQIISEGLHMRNLYVASTSGSSGHPFFFAKDKDSHAITHAIILQRYAEHGITPALKQARFYGIPIRGVSKYREKLKDFLSNRVRFSVFDLSDRRLSLYLEKFRTHKFGYVYGYTSAIVQFANYLIRQNLVLQSICPTLRCCMVTSEMCSAQDRAVIERAFGVSVINEYGCSESGLIAFEDRAGVWALVEEDSYFEVVDTAGNVLPWGSEGRILVTSLSNRALPIIRYEIGDIGVIDCVEGRLVLRQLTGRVSDLVRLPSGRVAGGLVFYYVSRSILERDGFVKEFIVRQTALDRFEFDVVAERDFTKKELDFLQNQLDAYLEPNLHLVVRRVAEITRPSSGKIKHFYSEI